PVVISRATSWTKPSSKLWPASGRRSVDQSLSIRRNPVSGFEKSSACQRTETGFRVTDGTRAMETETLTIETHPARSEVDFLDDQINAYNLATTGIPFGGLLACFVRDKAGQIVAGIYGWTWGDCCEIKSLWVHADWRRQRYGTRLLQVAEQEAARRGCAQIVLSTHSFQAPEFYRKRGYEVVGSVEGYPREHQSIYLRKSLERLTHGRP